MIHNIGQIKWKNIFIPIIALNPLRGKISAIANVNVKNTQIVAQYNTWNAQSGISYFFLINPWIVNDTTNILATNESKLELTVNKWNINTPLSGVISFGFSKSP